MSRDWTQEYFGITDNTPVSNTESNLRRKLEIAVKAINSAAEYLACMDDLSEFNNGKCNEQMAFEALNESLAKIKEIK